MKEVKLGKYGKWTSFVSDEDFELVSKYRWTRARTDRNCDYAVCMDAPHVRMHRLVMGVIDQPGVFVDHKNHNGLDNTRENLRTCTKSQNCSNRRPKKNASSKYLGVSKSSPGRWSAAICKMKNYRFLGVFDSEEEAAMAYNEAAKVLHGEFANLNQV